MKICFWGNFAKVLKGNSSGGGELQQALLARALAMAGNEVVILDYEIGTEFKTADGIRVLPIRGWNRGIRMIRTLTHRLPNLYLSLRDQKADIYYCRIRDFRHILAFAAARKVKAKFVLGLASDLDISAFRTRWKYFYLSNLRSLWVFFNGLFSEIVYPFILRNADKVLAQHYLQRDYLSGKNIDSTVLPNLVDPGELPECTNYEKKGFIYVGSLDKRKGFTDFFNLVINTPSYFYKVVGLPRDRTGMRIYKELRSFENVTLMGSLSHKETMRMIAESKGMISTSPMEGFPNVFLEAWACGIPVYSLYVDPGNVIKNQRLGTVAEGDLNKLITGMGVDIDFDELSIRARSYINRNHVLDRIKLQEVNTLFVKINNEDFKN